MITFTMIVDNNEEFRVQIKKCAERNGWTGDADINEEEFVKKIFKDFLEQEAKLYDEEILE